MPSLMRSLNMTGRHAMVTGAGSGIGRAVAMMVAASGAGVVVQDRDADGANETMASLERVGAAQHAVAVGDITDEARIDEIFVQSPACIDLLVHAAGIDHVEGDGSLAGTDMLQAFAAMSLPAFQRMLAVHVDGGFLCTRAMVRRLVQEQRPGSIVYLSSMTGVAGYGPVHYATAKAGLLGLMRSVARSGAPYGIRANALAPGMIDTPMTQKLPADFLEYMRSQTPLGAMGTTQDIAELAVFVLGDSAAFLTGQVLSPNGGMVIA